MNKAVLTLFCHFCYSACSNLEWRVVWRSAL